MTVEELLKVLADAGIDTAEKYAAHVATTQALGQRDALQKSVDAARSSLTKAQQAEQTKVLLAQKALTDFDAARLAGAAQVAEVAIGG